MRRARLAHQEAHVIHLRHPLAKDSTALCTKAASSSWRSSAWASVSRADSASAAASSRASSSARMLSLTAALTS